MILNDKIGIGTVQFGLPYGVSNSRGQTSLNEAKAILNFAKSNQINYLDTAPAYGNAEIVLGTIGIDQFRVISKFMPSTKNESLNIQLENTFNNLKIDSLYGYIAHRPMELNQKQWDDLFKLKQEKKIKKIGFSLNRPEELDILLDKGMTPDLIQVPYNYFDNRFKRHLIEMKEKGCEIHARSPFLQGLFFTKDALPSFFDEVKKEIADLKINFGDQLSAVLLKYSLSADFIDVVIMGVENVFQLEKNLSDIKTDAILTAKEFNFSDSVLMPSNWPKK